jgi:amino acid transporter/mannitol/fructose-specific phosphotransferase system IIA component (Ntr-type)
MPVLDQKSRLKKQLSLIDVYAIATGATLSSGLFMLPGIAAESVGPAVVLAYLLAAVPLVPAMFSVVELATAMPRAGGAYYFIDRTLGPVAGTIGGMGTWLALTLKTAFALIGMGWYAKLFLPEGAPYKLIACGLAVAFGVVNMLGSRKAGRMQVGFVFGLLLILIWFVSRGAFEINAVNFTGFFDVESHSLIATAGMVYISYVGVTKVASVAEEVEAPDRNLPWGVILALLTAVLVYAGCITVMTGVIPWEEFGGDMTAAATAAEALGGRTGVIVISVAAILAFSSVTNAGILASSRYPLAMSRDHLLPRALRRLSARQTPVVSTVVTLGAIIVFVLVFEPKDVAKLASSFQLLMFALLCFAVIVMRESGLDSYDPGFRSPLYPWMQVVGILAPLLLIGEMGWLSMLFSIGLVVVGLGWYRYYASSRVDRSGAIRHVFERLGRRRFDDLDRELRGILKEKGLRQQDPFVEIIARAQMIDAADETTFDEIVAKASAVLADVVPQSEAELARGFLEGTRIGATPVSRGTALPHLRLPGLTRPVMVVVRSQAGIPIQAGTALGKRPPTPPSLAVFFLVSPDEDPGQHLRLLAELASRVDQEDFLAEWREAEDAASLKQVLLRHERFALLELAPGTPTDAFINCAIRDLDIPEGSLVAVIRRAGEMIVPGGDTVLREGDHLTVIGSEDAIRECNVRYGGGAAGA